MLNHAIGDGFVLPACKLVEGGVDDDKFYDWAVTYLKPRLRRYDRRRLKNSIVVLDNAVIHNQPRFKQTLSQLGGVDSEAVSNAIAVTRWVMEEIPSFQIMRCEGWRPGDTVMEKYRQAAAQVETAEVTEIA